MEKMLTNVGNSKAVILPALWVQRLGSNKVTIEEIEDGIIIRAADKSSLQLAADKLRKKKVAIYKAMERQASDPDTQHYYANALNNFSDVDPAIISE